jgi:hypothetical protein
MGRGGVGGSVPSVVGRDERVMGKTFNFGAVVGGYIVTGVVVALAIHFIAFSSPRYRWISPPRAPIAASPGATQGK